MFQTLKYLIILGGVTFISGNRMLRQIAKYRYVNNDMCNCVCDKMLAMYSLHTYMLVTCWLHVGYMLVTCWLRVGYMLVTCWLHVGYMLVTFYCNH